VKYCLRCVYPENTRPRLLIDEYGICSACHSFEERANKSDEYWSERKEALKNVLDKARENARKNDSPYDCIIPVSGGKDSHYQTYLITQVYKMKPLLVAYNHGYNSRLGIRNLNNLVSTFGCDLIRYNTNPKTAKKLSLFMLSKVGDMTWHHHSGIFTFPFQIAVKYKVPLVIYGEDGGGYFQGMFNLDDQVEFTQKHRQEIAMRGFEPDDVLNDPNNTEITKNELAPFYFPSDEEMESVGVRGIYVSNFDKWNQVEHAELMINKYGFQTYQTSEQTFNLHSSIDDLFEGTHNYLKYLKFGYSRCTDHASMEIRHQRMSREEAIEMVRKYEYQKRPKNLDLFLKFVEISEQEFLNKIEHLRDPQIWEKNSKDEWRLLDWVGNHILDKGVEDARFPLKGKWRYITSRRYQDPPVNYDYGNDEEIIPM
jgi:N-acetyl sugar amidotransferase